jgi:DNA-binding PadR family transcriptional regulator
MTFRPTRPSITEYAVLGLLAHVGRPVSGYDLRKIAATTIGLIWQPSKTQVYSVLRDLEAAGLTSRRDVKQSDKPDKHLYRITRAGHIALREWLDRNEHVSDLDRFRRVVVLKIFFGRQGDRTSLSRQLEALRDAYAVRLALYERILKEPPHPLDDEYTQLTLRYGIVRMRAHVEWADAALKDLVVRQAPSRSVSVDHNA